MQCCCAAANGIVNRKSLTRRRGPPAPSVCACPGFRTFFVRLHFRNRRPLALADILSPSAKIPSTRIININLPRSRRPVYHIRATGPGLARKIPGGARRVIARTIGEQNNSRIGARMHRHERASRWTARRRRFKPDNPSNPAQSRARSAPMRMTTTACRPRPALA